MSKLHSKLQNKNIIAKLRVVVLVVVLLFVGAVGWYYITRYSDAHQTRIATDCSSLVKNVQSITKQKQYKQNYQKLKDNWSKCSQLASAGNGDSKKATSTEIKRQFKAAEYQGELAKAAYLSGDKKQARQYAKKAVEIDGALQAKQLKTIPEPQRIRFFGDMYGITSGTYYFNGSVTR